MLGRDFNEPLEHAAHVLVLLDVRQHVEHTKNYERPRVIGLWEHEQGGIALEFLERALEYALRLDHGFAGHRDHRREAQVAARSRAEIRACTDRERRERREADILGVASAVFFFVRNREAVERALAETSVRNRR
jgi:hypothetical protein